MANLAEAKDALPSDPPITREEGRATFEKERQRALRAAWSAFRELMERFPDQEVRSALIPLMLRENISFGVSTMQVPFHFVPEARTLYMHPKVTQWDDTNRFLWLAEEWIRMEAFAQGRLWDGRVPADPAGRKAAAEKIWATTKSTLILKWKIVQNMQREDLVRPSPRSLFRKGEYDRATLLLIQHAAPKAMTLEEYRALEVYWQELANPRDSSPRR